MTNPEGEVFLLRPYRGQYAHLGMVLGLFGAMLVLGLFAALAQRILPAPWPTALLTLGGLGYAAFVLTIPQRWRRMRREGYLLHIDGAQLRLVDSRTRRVLARCDRAALGVERAIHHYQVTIRAGGGGTYRAPVLILRIPGQTELSVAPEGSPLHWRDSPPRIPRPQRTMSRDDWPHLVAALGLAEHLTHVTSARVVWQRAGKRPSG